MRLSSRQEELSDPVAEGAPPLPGLELRNLMPEAEIQLGGIPLKRVRTSFPNGAQDYDDGQFKFEVITEQPRASQADSAGGST